MFENLSYEEYSFVVGPKVTGTRNLHEMLCHNTLDFFVMLCSACGVVGRLGQSIYAGSSTFQDAFATNCAWKGQPAISIDLGVVRGAGYVAQNPELQPGLEQSEIRSMSLQHFLTVLAYATMEARPTNGPSQIVAGLQRSSNHEANHNLRETRFLYLKTAEGLVMVPIGATEGQTALSKILSSLSTEEEIKAAISNELVVKLARCLGKQPAEMKLEKSPSYHGADSLVAVELNNWIYSETGATFSATQILTYQSLITLSGDIARWVIRNREEIVRKDREMEDEGDRESRIMKLVEKLTKDLPIAVNDPSKLSPPSDGKFVLMLYGSTGSLGAFLLHQLLQCDRVKKVYCLNRSTSALDRIKHTLSVKKKISDELDDPSRCEFLVARLDKPLFSLDSTKFSELRDTVDYIIHNAWHVNHNESLEYFEYPHLRSIESLINFSFKSSRHPHIFFISSLAAISNTIFGRKDREASAEINGDAYRPEPNSPIKVGYAESKYAAECILSAAASRSQVGSTIIRLGQLTGPHKGNSDWKDSEWFPSLVKSCKMLNMAPRSIGTFYCDEDRLSTWFAADDAARGVADLIETSLNSKQGSSVRSEPVHLVNSKPCTWSDIMSPVIQHLRQNETGRDLQIVSYEDWLESLKKHAKEIGLDPRHPVSAHLSRMFTLALDYPRDTVSWMDNYPYAKAHTVADTTPIDSNFIASWLVKWGI